MTVTRHDRRPATCVLLLIQALVLGLLQGLTEFLPVSSSGHLQGVPYLLGWEGGGNLAFDVMVHAGTLVAVVWYFRTDLWELTRGVLGIGIDDENRRRQARRLLTLLVIGTVPAAATGYFLEPVFESAFRSPRIVAGFLYVTAVVLWSVERLQTRRREIAAVGDDPTASKIPSGDFGRGGDSLNAADALTVGVAQAAAILPGISRSGATIAAGMTLGLSRAAAARFSFLLAVPIILGAVVFKLPDVGTTVPGTLPFGPVEIAVGVVAAAVSGYWAIRVLLSLLQRRGMTWFAGYVAVFATILLVGSWVV